MVQADDSKLGCICPECFNRCRDCLGTDSVMSREQLKALKDDPIALAMFMAKHEKEED
jgi:hypothetical protein